MALTMVIGMMVIEMMGQQSNQFDAETTRYATKYHVAKKAAQYTLHGALAIMNWSTSTDHSHQHHHIVVQFQCQFAVQQAIQCVSIGEIEGHRGDVQLDAMAVMLVEESQVYQDRWAWHPHMVPQLMLAAMHLVFCRMQFADRQVHCATNAQSHQSGVHLLLSAKAASEMQV